MAESAGMSRAASPTTTRRSCCPLAEAARSRLSGVRLAPRPARLDRDQRGAHTRDSASVPSGWSRTGPPRAGFLVHGGEQMLWTAYVNGGVVPRGADFVRAVKNHRRARWASTSHRSTAKSRATGARSSCATSSSCASGS